MDDQIFRHQIKEDLVHIKENIAWDSNIYKDEYAFNYWILSNLYNLDEQVSNNYITEYNDKGVDCFVHFEDEKELYIIQNKYYSEDTVLSSKEVSDFITRPISTLKSGNYKRSIELQKIYSQVKDDPNYKIFLHFYVTNDKRTSDIDILTQNYKSDEFIFKLFYLQDIKDKYYGQDEVYKQQTDLNTKLNVFNKATYLAIRPNEYKLPNMSEAYYVMAKINDIYNLYKDATDKKYPLFEENIREYLGGTSGINKGIINTLRDKDQRGNFFYYNNGITIICKSAKADSKEIKIENPQIVNGCQTVNSIYEVLKNDINPYETFGDVYVMVKILILEKKDTQFYKNIVKYTNSQNSINDKNFGASLQPFFTIQEKLQNYGIILNVKQSDKYQFKSLYKGKELHNLLEKANRNKDIYEFKNINDLMINLELLIQIILAVKKDAFYSYTKKSVILKPSNQEYFENFSKKIGDFFTTESMMKLILLYKKAELDKKNSADKKSPSPYYLINFLGYYLKKNNIKDQNFFQKISMPDLNFVYDKFKKLSSKYYEKFKEIKGLEYNQMIKQKIDQNILDNILETHMNSLEEYSEDEYNKLMNIFKNISSTDTLVVENQLKIQNLL